MTKPFIIPLFLFLSLTTTNAMAEKDPVINMCINCHGKEGNATIPGWPAIAGMSKHNLISKLKSYRAKSNPESRMSDVTHSFTDSQIEEIANYYSQKPSPEKRN